MKVQVINNNYSNVSHKAYFKPNAEFKTLWVNRPINREVYLNKMQKVKNELPEHEIEIIDSGRSLINDSFSDFYLLFNNMTKKALGVAIAVETLRNHFETVLECLLEKNERTENFFNYEIVNSLDFRDITTDKTNL